MKKTGQKLLSVIFSITILLSLATGGFAENAEDGSKAQNSSDVLNTILKTGDRGEQYILYKEKHSASLSPKTQLLYKTENTVLKGEAVVETGFDKDNKPSPVVKFNGMGNIEWTVTVPESGNYNISFGYYIDEDTANDINASFLINGKSPFIEVGEISFPRFWYYDQNIETDNNGNEKRPDQHVEKSWREHLLKDSSGKVYAFSFYLGKGENKLKLEVENAGLIIESLKIFNEDKISSYEDYKKEGAETSGYQEIYQAEKLVIKNDSSIRIGTDRSDSGTIPSDPVALRINTVDGNSWKYPGHTIYWDIDIPQDGNYKLGFRYRQNQVPGIATQRRLTINGKTPFSEAGELQFPYSDSWIYTEPGNQDGAYSIYLEKGVYRIGLEAVTAEFGPIIQELENYVYVMNYLYRKIIVITGTQPDSYRDYALDKDIPELIPAFIELQKGLKALGERIESLSDRKGGYASILYETSSFLSTLIDKPFNIPDRLSNFSTNMSSVSSLMLLLQEQPLDLDYITVSDYETKVKMMKTGFFSNILFHIKAFIGSFFNDFSTISSGNYSSDNTIRVWYGGSQEQAEIVRKMIDSSFSEKYGVGVELELAQVTISQAIIAGTAPDVVMNVSRGQPVNLAVRDALYSINDLEGFDDITKEFPKTAFEPYTFGGKTYAVPITMSYQLLFTRDDILSGFGVDTPQSWDDIYRLLPLLQRNNMTIGLPYTKLSSQATIDGGMGAKDIFPALLMQNGGKVYNDNSTASALDQESAMKAFKMWTELYAKYELPLEYDFFNRFRSGEMPIGVQDYSTYNLLSAAAPEIRGLWSMSLLPGTTQSDGTVDRTAGASGTASVIVKTGDNEDKLSASWKFLKWWGSSDVQTQYGIELETLMGVSSRYNPANIEAFKKLPWGLSEKELLLEQMSWIKEVPEIPGGYYTSRSLDNAFRNTVFQQLNYRNALLDQIEIINAEISRKRREFNLD